jgi:hypothetical protein
MTTAELIKLEFDKVRNKHLDDLSRLVRLVGTDVHRRERTEAPQGLPPDANREPRGKEW